MTYKFAIPIVVVKNKIGTYKPYINAIEIYKIILEYLECNLNYGPEYKSIN